MEKGESTTFMVRLSVTRVSEGFGLQQMLKAVDDVNGMIDTRSSSSTPCAENLFA